MILRRSVIYKYLLIAAFGVVLFNEFIVYYIQTLSWHQLECSNNDPYCVKVLFVSDPQIQGELFAPFPLNKIFIWDSDEYVKKTFYRVIDHFRPEVIVYLGDLMDEGSISTIKDFHKYVKRLSEIFDVHYPIVQVWLPGDNDIGGEGEPLRHDKVAEFNNVFLTPPMTTYKNISFFNVNAITNTIPTVKNVSDFALRIIVSHYPIAKRTMFGKQVVSKLKPHISFCGHDHTSKYARYSSELWREELRYFYDKELTVVFNNSLYEMYVPTCSYRMGTNEIGYGVAVFENNYTQMRYTVLWTPDRFKCLFLYLFTLLLIFCVAIRSIVYKCCICNLNRICYKSYYSPLNNLIIEK